MAKKLCTEMSTFRLKITPFNVRVSTAGMNVYDLQPLHVLEKELRVKFDWQPPDYLVPRRAKLRLLQLLQGHKVLIEEDGNELSGTDKLFVEYVGACKRRTKETVFWLNKPPNKWDKIEKEPYASGWVDDGWNIVFPESVLRAFFPLEKPFDGNFHKLLLQSKDLSREYKQLARKYHPDLNEGRSRYFLKLKKAYDDLKDPMRRKRYEAGLKFQKAVVEKVDDVVFRVPKSCGMVTVIGEPDDMGRLCVMKILAWEDIRDERGRTLVAKWSKPASTYGELERKPFYHEYEFKGDIEFEVTI